MESKSSSQQRKKGFVKKGKEIFYTPKQPKDLTKGMSWIEIDQEVADRLDIWHQYQSESMGGRHRVITPSGEMIMAYLDNPNSFGGRGRKKYEVHTHGEILLISASQRLTIDALIHFLENWVDPDAILITDKGRRRRIIDSSEPTVFVYFIYNSDSQAIKIGQAKDVQKRLDNLQVANPVELKLLKKIALQDLPSARRLESELHDRFSDLHIHGEWFRAEPLLIDFIDLQTND